MSAPTESPFESFQGETATPTSTPPPTSTDNGQNGTETPLFALLICVLFGGLGLLAVQGKRRGLHR